jgi:hypothetical protein
MVRRDFVRGDVSANRSQRCIQHRVRDESERLMIGAAEQPPAKTPQALVNLALQPDRPYAHLLRPVRCQKVFPAIEQENACFRQVHTDSLWQVERRCQPGVPRHGAAEDVEIAVLERCGRAQPDLPKEYITGRKTVVDRPRGCTKRTRNRRHSRGSRAVRRDEPRRGSEDLLFVEFRAAGH